MPSAKHRRRDLAIAAGNRRQVAQIMALMAREAAAELATLVISENTALT